MDGDLARSVKHFIFVSSHKGIAKVNLKVESVGFFKKLFYFIFFYFTKEQTLHCRSGLVLYAGFLV